MLDIFPQTHPTISIAGRLKATLLMSLCILLLGGAQAQGFRTLTGVVRDRETNEAVPYATIRLNTTAIGVVANTEGKFELVLPDSVFQEPNVVFVAAVGFRTNVLRLARARRDTLETVFLRSEAYEIGEIEIKAPQKSPAAIIAEAFKHIPQNYPTAPYVLQLFYRHYCFEGEQYGRLIEAAIEIEDSKGYKTLHESPEDKFQVRVRQLRRSYDFTSRSGRVHAPMALFALLRRDIASFEHPLHAQPAAFQYTVSDTSMFDGEPVYIIDFDQEIDFQERQLFAGTAAGDTLIKRGRLYISAQDFAFLQTEFSYFARYRANDSLYVQDRHQTVQYRKIGDKYYLSHIVSDGYEQEPNLPPHKYHIELMSNNVLLAGEFSPIKGGEPTKERLLGIGYNPVFWDDYSILAATPLEEKIAADLAVQTPLEEQFANYNRLYNDPDSLSALEWSQFDKITQAYRGKLLYVLFWNSRNKASVKEVLATRDLAYRYMGLGVTFFFISTDEDEATWEHARNKYAPAGAEHLHAATGAESDLMRQFGVEMLPHYFVIAPNGKLLRENILPPSNRKLYLQLQTILRGEWKEDK